MKNDQRNYREVTISQWLKAWGVAFGMIGLMAQPGQALWIGQSQVNPFLEVRGDYETNIFQVEKDEDSDFITVISPGVHYEYPTTPDSPIRFVANYRADIKLYGNNDDAAIDPQGELNTINHRFDTALRFEMASGMRLRTDYVFGLNSNNPSSRGDTRDKYAQHDLTAGVGYVFANVYEIEVAYKGLFKMFSDSINEQDDVAKNGAEIIGYYRILPKLSLLAGGDYAKVGRNEPFFDSTEYAGFGGVRYEPTEDITGVLKAGIAARSFDSSEVEDASDFYASGELQGKILDQTTWSVLLFRQYHDTELSNETA